MGRDGLRSSACARHSISIHSPRMGRDSPTRPRWPSTGDFNPLSPHGERRGVDGPERSVEHFNPLSPHGERREGSADDAFLLTFQSTLPAWGETGQGRGGRLRLPISIHSPRMGRDRRLRTTSASATYFNPLSPHGERQQTHTTFRREKLAHLHNIVSFRQQRGSSC